MFEQELSAYWETVVNTRKDGLMVVDRAGTILCVNRAIEADGSDTWSYYQRADLLRGLGRRQEAIEHLERCLALGIDDPLIDLVKYIVQRLRRELASSLAEQGESIERFSPGVKRYFSQIGNAMAVWVDVCKKIMSHE